MATFLYLLTLVMLILKILIMLN